MDGVQGPVVIIQTNRQQDRTQNTAMQESHDAEIERPIHQYSSRCEQSLQLCAKENSKPAVPSCEYLIN